MLLFVVFVIDGKVMLSGTTGAVMLLIGVDVILENIPVLKLGNEKPPDTRVVLLTTTKLVLIV